eukprot:7204129-Prymnesium_polylepis.1
MELGGGNVPVRPPGSGACHVPSAKTPQRQHVRSMMAPVVLRCSLDLELWHVPTAFSVRFD